MFKKEVERLISEVVYDLRSCSQSYYDIGINIFHESRLKGWIDFQPAIGNLSIAVEILLKALIAQKSISLLYSNLPDEAILLLCYPESLSNSHNSKGFINDLKNFTYKTIELDKAISLFYHFFPSYKQEYRQFLSSLSVIRNISVHASVPDFQRYELDRIAYFSTKLFTLIYDQKVFEHYSFKQLDKTEKFMQTYEDDKVKKVKDAISNARQNVKNGNLNETDYFLDNWQSMLGSCPICGGDAIYYGETEEEIDHEGLHLSFLCDSLSCGSCGLELEDFEELEWAGVETTLDRSEDADEWAYEHGYFEDDDRG